MLQHFSFPVTAVSSEVKLMSTPPSPFLLANVSLFYLASPCSRIVRSYSLPLVRSLSAVFLPSSSCSCLTQICSLCAYDIFSVPVSSCDRRHTLTSHVLVVTGHWARDVPTSTRLALLHALMLTGTPVDWSVTSSNAVPVFNGNITATVVGEPVAGMSTGILESMACTKEVCFALEPVRHIQHADPYSGRSGWC